MSKSVYYPTHLERWIYSRYKRMGILSPEDLNIEKLCYVFHIFIKRFPVSSSCFEIGKYKEIILNSQLDIKEQREDFYHELCHLLRHSGRQMMMPNAFRELQEWDANNFVRYAAIPFHMLHEFDFKDAYIIETLSDRFQVTEKLCKQRLEKIYQNKVPQKVAEATIQYS